jgi:hypothetical protein
LVANNMTTSETFKWTPINEACKVFKVENSGRSYGDKLREDAVRRAGDDPALLHDIPAFHASGLPVNIYDRGVLFNFLEVALPRTFAREGPVRNGGARSKVE